MATFLIILVLALLSLALVYGLARIIDSDGYGNHPAPRTDGWGDSLTTPSRHDVR